MIGHIEDNRQPALAVLRGAAVMHPTPLPIIVHQKQGFTSSSRLSAAGAEPNGVDRGSHRIVL